MKLADFNYVLMSDDLLDIIELNEPSEEFLVQYTEGLQ